MTASKNTQKFSVAYRFNGNFAKPSFWAPKQKYPLGVREDLGVEEWSPGALPRPNVRNFNLPRIGVALRSTANTIRTLRLICGNDFIDRALANLLGKHLYGDQIVDAFLWRGYPHEP